MTNILIKLDDYTLEPQYLKIKEIENSISSTFIEKFFENPISEYKKYREITLIYKLNILFSTLKNFNLF